MRARGLPVDHVLRIEADAPLSDLSPAMQDALVAMIPGRIYRWRGVYVALREDGRTPKPPVYERVTVNALIRRGYAKEFCLIGTGPDRIFATLTGEGAWRARTIVRQRERAASSVRSSTA